MWEGSFLYFLGGVTLCDHSVHLLELGVLDEELRLVFVLGEG